LIGAVQTIFNGNARICLEERLFNGQILRITLGSNRNNQMQRFFFCHSGKGWNKYRQAKQKHQQSAHKRTSFGVTNSYIIGSEDWAAVICYYLLVLT